MKTINSFRSKFFALVLALVASVSSFAKDGYPDFQVDGLYYNFLEGDSVQVTFLMPPTIPTEVAADTSNKKNVSGAGYVHLTEIVIPSTVIYEDKTYHVTRIGHGAFMYCPNLMHIDLPTSIKSIGEGAFHNCRYLSSITLNEGLESIEQQAFWGCPTLKEVSLPSTLKSLKQKVFYDSKALSKVTCKALVPPSVEKDLLTGTDNYNASIIPNATLYVPASSLTTYQNTYPWNTFGQILSIEDSLQNIFPTLWGLQRTDVELSTIEGYVDPYHLSFKEYTPTLVNGKLYLCDGRNYFREENNQVLLYAPYLGMEEDLVLYDWTLEVGDTLPFKPKRYTDEQLGMLFRVTDVSTIQLLDGKEYKKWTFSGGYEFVEGIGAINKGFGHFYCLRHTTHTGMSAGQRLVCASRNGQLLIDNTEKWGVECQCEIETSYKSQWCNKWNVMWFDGMRFDETARTSKYRLGKDTVIGDYTYSKFISGTYVRFTDDRKVYVYHEYFDDHDPYSEDLPTGEYLAYDFSAKVGDTLEVFSGIHSYTTEQCVVYDVQTDPETNLRTIMLHPLRVVDSDGHIGVSDEEITWLEGVGSPNGFLISTPLPGGGSYVLLCAYKDDELKYTGSFYEHFGCEYNAGVVSDDLFPTLSGLQRTICREYCEQADNKTRIEQFTNLTTRTETGAPYIYCSPFLLREKDNKIMIYSRSLNKDLVLYDFNLQVGDSLPMLYIDTEAKDDWIADRDMDIWYVVDYHKDLEGNILPADTLIVTDVSMITLLDGKEYKKWTFNNGMEYVEGIGSFGNGQWSGDLFQLIANKDVPTCLLDEHLVCASKNGQLLYKMDDAEKERLGAECLCEYNAEQKPEDLFPTLWGLQRTSCTKTIGEDEYGTVWGSRSYLMQEIETTTIDGKQYLLFGTDNTYDEYCSLWLREENNKILLYSTAQKKDLVLYDFTLNVGDSLPRLYVDYDLSSVVDYDNDEWGLSPLVVTEVSTITLLDGKEYKKWTFDNGMQYVEGIGSFGTCYAHNDFYQLIANAPLTSDVYSQHLVCVSKNGQLLYKMDDAEMEQLETECLCEYNTEQKPEDLFPTLWGLQRTDIEEHTTCDGKPYLSDFEEYVTTQMNGKLYLSDGRNYLREENNQVLFCCPDFEIYEDIVLYDWTLEIGDTLPHNKSTVHAESDFIVKNVSTVTLLDGKKYKKWTLACGYEYIEGIGAINGEGYGHYLCLESWVQPGTYIRTCLVCASRDGQLLYKMDDAEMERLGAECLCEIEQKWSETWCNQWNILSHGYLGPQDPLAGARTSIYWLSNNTVNRNGQEYIPLMCSSSLPNEESTHLVGELRFTEDKQVYFYYAFDETEYLLYDFGAELGDTLELFAGLEFYNYHKTYTHVITDKETLDDGRLQIQADVVIRIDNGAGEYFEEKHPVTWIEGLGSTYGIIFNPSNPGVCGDGAIIMLCAYRDDECVYTTNFSDYKNMGCVYNNDGTVDEDLFPMLAGLQRTICNEFCGDTEDDNSSNTTYKQTFDKILFERDQPYIYCNSAFLLREENNKILIYSHSLDKDLVLYDFTLEVGDSLPQLYLDEEAKKDIYWIYYEYMNVVDYNKYNDSIYPADTLIVTDVSMITLLDGKEYKKWTFNNGMEYVEGIGMYGGRRGGNFFGLIQEVVVPCHTGTHLVCASKNGQLLYQMDNTEMERLGAECLCDYNSGPKKDNAKEGKIGGRPTPTQWNMLELDLREMENGNTIVRAETFSYTLENDSIVTNGKTFYQLARQSTKDTAITKSFVGALHFGEDEDNRVYFFRDGQEYVLYDFTAEPGDTLEIFAGINNYPQYSTYTHIVTGKDTIENGACRMLLQVIFPDETTTAANVEKIWLAGLGSVDGIVHNAAKQTSDVHAAPSRSARSGDTQASIMLCAWREDSCLYTTDHPDYDTFGCVYNQDPTAVETILAPQSSYRKFIRDGQLFILHNGTMYNVIGLEMK